MLASGTLAQLEQPSALPNTSADQIADQTVRQWQAGKFKPVALDPQAIAATESPTELLQKQLRALSQQVQFTPAPKDARVSFNLRRVTQEKKARVYTYPVTSSSLGDEILTVTLVQADGTWKAESVQIGSNADLIPEFVKTIWGAWLFAAISALLLWASIAKTPWRTLLEQNVQTIDRKSVV